MAYSFAFNKESFDHPSALSKQASSFISFQLCHGRYCGVRVAFTLLGFAGSPELSPTVAEGRSPTTSERPSSR